MVPRPRATLALLGAAALLAGCNGEPATTTDTDAVLRLKLREYRITPQNLRVETTGEFQRIKVIAENVGRLTHNVVIEPEEEQDAQGVVEDRVDPPLRTATAQPGTRVEGEVYLRPGTYRILSSISNQENLGMYGTLTIVRK